MVYDDAHFPGPTSTIVAPSAVINGTLKSMQLEPMQTRSALGYSSSFNASAILAKRQEYEIQVIASTFSSCSVLASLCAIYWFCMMRRNFRRDLILLLICGDLWKAFWFLVFSTMSLSTGRVSTTSAFCQASGYFLQVGIEACDVAVLLMSLHMSLQIFPPKCSFLGHDGLYRVRYFVWATWFIVPNVLVSLAFINSHQAFVSQGGFCTLPIRPFWYRLAISWIPRYLIWLYVMFVAIRIYQHVGFEFRVFGQEKDGSSSVPESSPANTKPSEVMVPMQRDLSTQSDAATVEKGGDAEDSIAPDELGEGPPIHGSPSSNIFARLKAYDGSRRQSVPTWAAPFGDTGAERVESFSGPASQPRSKSNPSSRRGSRQIAAGIGAEDFAPPLPIHLERHRGSISTLGSTKSNGASYDQTSGSPALGTITEQTPMPNVGDNVANKAMQKRRRAIQRQLRLLFIYPVVYMMMWVMPFVAHALNYSNHFAQHPVFAVTALSIFCQNAMGFTDVCVFCWRERPWRHIPGSDGTFFGSFMFWRFAFGQKWVEQRRKSSAPMHIHGEKEGGSQGSQSGLLGSLKRWSMSFSAKAPSPRPSQASMGDIMNPQAARKNAPPMHRRTHSGGSDRRIMQAERAAERLAMERADYEQHRRSFNERRTSVIGANLLAQEQQTNSARKEWWDRHLSITADDALDTEQHN